MEVHPPEHGIHSWRDFLVHMGTICLGLLIALGLEQGVIAIHEAHERAELRAALARDTRQAIANTRLSERWTDQWSAWLLARIGQVRAALASNSPLAAPPPHHIDQSEVAVDPAFRAAKTSGLIALLPQREVLAYSEADSCVDDVLQYRGWANKSLGNLNAYEFEFQSANGTTDFSHATPEELHRYLDLLTDALLGVAAFRFANQELRGAEMALARGDLDLNAMYKAELIQETPVLGLKTK